MKGYVVKSSDGYYVGNITVMTENILYAFFYSTLDEAKKCKDRISEAYPIARWEVILINIEEVEEVE